MSTPRSSTVDPALVDFTALARWMDDQGLPPGDFTEVTELTGGTQNVMLRLRRGDQVYVLRRRRLHAHAIGLLTQARSLI
ncbi:hypothetical protein AB0L13_38685 [Saccharopolyspora shandongensis]|uniref:hypothetical protein n=1 Tax=Saccharopolyspora shandongensis TaxID=418495 RepID=UPI0034387DF1